MSVNQVRYATADGAAWGAVRGSTVVPLPAEHVSTADVLTDGAQIARALVADPDATGRPPESLRLLTPVPGARVLC